MKRMRVVGWNVQPVIMVDDDVDLIPVQVAATMIPASGWEQFKAGGDKLALDDLRQRVETNGSV